MAQQISSDRKEHAPPSSLDGAIDDMLACHSEWRLHAGAVVEAQEEHTATKYAAAVRQVERRLQEA